MTFWSFSVSSFVSSNAQTCHFWNKRTQRDESRLSHNNLGIFLFYWTPLLCVLLGFVGHTIGMREGALWWWWDFSNMMSGVIAFFVCGLWWGIMTVSHVKYSGFGKPIKHYKIGSKGHHVIWKREWGVTWPFKPILLVYFYGCIRLLHFTLLTWTSFKKSSSKS